MKKLFFVGSVLLFVWLFPQVVFGQGWEWQNPLPQGNTLRDVQLFSANTAIAVGDAGTVMKTTDGGESWLYKIAKPFTNYSTLLLSVLIPLGFTKYRR